MNKTLVFDMDGTIADLYGVKNWLSMLCAYDPTPYSVAKPMYNMAELTTVLHKLKSHGWIIVVTSWLSKGSTPEYDKKVREAKKSWLKKYNFPTDEVHLVKYGTTKANCTRKRGGLQVLVDDNKKIRDGWTLGKTIDATENIIPQLASLLEE